VAEGVSRMVAWLRATRPAVVELAVSEG
jgi:hypothetical protein